MIYIYNNKRKKKKSHITPSETQVWMQVCQSLHSASVKHPHDITISPKRRRLTSGLPDIPLKPLSVKRVH